jgi:hypothetical protein
VGGEAGDTLAALTAADAGVVVARRRKVFIGG